MVSEVFPRWYDLRVGPQMPDVLDGVKIPKDKGKQNSSCQFINILLIFQDTVFIL